MGHALVVHCKKARYDIYIGRGSQWGNPFTIGTDGTRDEVIDLYEQWLLDQPELLSDLGRLAGKTLGCWCAPRHCHGEVLARLAARTPVPSPWDTAPASTGNLATATPTPTADRPAAHRTSARRDVRTPLV